jgi:hypothetical protein
MRWALLFTALIACSKTETIRADQHSVREPAPQLASQPTSQPTLEQEFPPVVELPPQVATLAKAPCDPVNAVYLCGTDGTIAKVFVAESTLPPGLHTLTNSHGPPFAVTVGLEPDRVWVLSPCRECRIPRDSIEVLALRTLKDEALAATQTQLGLPPSPLLRTPTAFRDALAKAGYKRPST